ncbi:MAG TPA: flavodoxin family protein [Vitreimonas sp.]|nr:flavodoxin family protein [Vitreimonas sp.]
MVVHAIYASTSGNVEAVIEKVAGILRAAGQAVELHRAEQTSLDVITNNDTFIIATSTWEHGELNPFFRKLLEEMKDQDFTGKRAAFIGLGDTRYEPVLFCQGMEIVRKAWIDQQGQQIFQTLKINGEPYHHLETVVSDWAQGLQQTLESQG